MRIQLCLRIKACHEFLQQNMQSIFKQAADTLAIYNTKESVIPDGLLGRYYAAVNPLNVNRFNIHIKCYVLFYA